MKGTGEKEKGKKGKGWGDREVSKEQRGEKGRGGGKQK